MDDRIDARVSLARDLKTLMLRLRGSMEKSLSPLGLTSSQYAMLSILAEEPDLSGAHLARKCHVTPQTVHKILGAIEREGWITREKRPTNEKTFFVKITPTGTRLLRKARPARYEVVKRMLRGFAATEIHRFAVFVHRCTDNL